jgi:NADH-quinone oxidoreductase subunit L
VATYSRYYLHREARFRSFYIIFHVFVLGLELLSFGGNFAILFAGWELVGIASFLLIAFYNERMQPVRSALYVLGIYRLCDLGLIFASILAHNEMLAKHSQDASWIALGLLLAAVGKSAQFPFSTWLRRAMEGPTPSSAVFYGALSVHAGVFLLIRSWPLISDVEGVRWVMGAVGVLSAIIATGAGRTESNIKAQIGWAAITQVGLMFIEISFGLIDLALVHMILNAILRCYQLLVSPSVVAALLREQSSLNSPRDIVDLSVESFLPRRLQLSLYSIAFSHAYMENVIQKVVLSLGRSFATGFAVLIPKNRFGFYILVGSTIVPVICHYFGLNTASTAALQLLISLVLFGVLQREDQPDLALGVWLVIAVNQVAMGFLMWIQNEAIGLSLAQSLFALVTLTIGLLARRMSAGRLREVLFFVATIILAGYPIALPFVAEDILVHHFLEHSMPAALMLGLSFALMGWMAIRAFVELEWKAFEISAVK